MRLNKIFFLLFFVATPLISMQNRSYPTKTSSASFDASHYEIKTTRVLAKLSAVSFGAFYLCGESSRILDENMFHKSYTFATENPLSATAFTLLLLAPVYKDEIARCLYLCNRNNIISENIKKFP